MFLSTVITSPVGGWFCLAHAKVGDDERRTKESWQEEFFSWPDEKPLVINRVRELGTNVEIYFSPYLFSEKASKKQYAIVGKTIVADLDEANVLTLQVEPSVLVETSPGRHQGYWILHSQLDNDEHEQLSKRLTYSIPRCDKTGWFLGKKVRVPETYNNKYTSGPQIVRVVRNNGKVYTNSQLEQIASVQEIFGKNVSIDIDEENLEWAEKALVQDVGPLEMLSRIRSSIPTIVARYGLLQTDRSAALWSLNMSLFRAGLPKEKIFFIAYHSPNNKFKELRYGGVRELAKDVLRAELAIKIQLPDVKSKIREARKVGDSKFDRNAYIARVVREHLDKLGVFIHTDDDAQWFIREDTGQPIPISIRNQALFHLLENTFGMNAQETDTSYVINNLGSMASELPVTGKVAQLSYYNHKQRLFILHTGRKDVLVVRPEGITRQTNGYQGIIFPWNVRTDTI